MTYEDLSSLDHLVDFSGEKAVRLKRLFDQREEIFSLYQEHVINLICRWLGSEQIKERIQFEKSGRVVIDGNLVLKESIEYLPAVIRKLTGKLTLVSGSQIRSIDYLEEARALRIDRANNLKSLKSLKKVEYGILITNSGLEDLSSLERVGSSVIIVDCPIKGIPNLQYVGEKLIVRNNEDFKDLSSLNYVSELDISGTAIEELPELENVVEKLDAEGLETLTSIPKLTTAGNIYLSGTSVTGLPSLVKVNGSLTAPELETLTDLSSLNEVEVDLDISRTNVASMRELQEVGRVFNAQATPLEHLPKLVKVGELKLENTRLKNLPALTRVIFGLSLKDSKSFEAADKLWWVGGDLDIRGTRIESLPELSTVQGEFNAEDLTTLTNLEKLAVVNGDCCIKGTSVQVLPNLVEVGGNLNILSLDNSKECWFPNLCTIKGRLQLTFIKEGQFPRLESIQNCLYILLWQKQQVDIFEVFPKLTTIKKQGDRDIPHVLVTDYGLYEQFKNAKKNNRINIEGRITLVSDV
jgi:hypothetical protein